MADHERGGVDQPGNFVDKVPVDVDKGISLARMDDMVLKHLVCHQLPPAAYIVH